MELYGIRKQTEKSPSLSKLKAEGTAIPERTVSTK